MAMWTGVEDHVSLSLSCDSQDAPTARQNLLIEAWLRDLILPAALAPPQPLPAERSGTKRKRPQHSPVLGEMDRNVRKMPPADSAIDIEMGETSAPKTPTSSPTKPKIAPGDGKGQDKTKRRQREDNAQAIHYIGVLRQVPPLPPPESRVVSRTPSEFTTTSTATASTASTQGRRRAKSPVKSLADLPYAETPVYAQSLTDVQELQDDTARELCIGLRQIASGRRVVPGCLRAHVDAQIERLTGLEEDELEDKHVATNGEDDYDALLAELSTLCGIVKQTKRALQPGSNFAEPHWNERIHSRVLEVALEPQATKEPHVAFFNVTVAKIATGCIPADVKGVDLEAKMVDYCIVLCDEEVQNAARHTISAHLHLQSQPSSQFASPRPVRSINQTEYTPLHLCPISVSIETKRSGGSEDQAQVQLSHWGYEDSPRLL
ncbi:hypothetical protein SLS63_013495 [Diaporthe eres]|uniref:PD-(D/E)XK nuclease-like domain-containing protein n=1 Tax=Diaporthe eres TaxID=83184 RepID=A0ABR1NNB9_DIAER